ncbi:uncharacterized protein BJX67DRAFT_364384 [Aspergillus lucknowensis]|uniref:Uncharacterized protein n=1 Tax=Aspergillus lucknowensis TaxID=176173 RepID=A0ABR4LGF8_9EURO
MAAYEASGMPSLSLPSAASVPRASARYALYPADIGVLAPLHDPIPYVLLYSSGAGIRRDRDHLLFGSSLTSVVRSIFLYSSTNSPAPLN